MTPRLAIRSLGVAGAVVDLGRQGRSWLGASRGGAVDPAALRLANRLVGNVEHEAGIETSGGLVVEATTSILVAVTGADADVSIRGRGPVGWGVPTVVHAGDEVVIGRVVRGARVYLAVRGGLADAPDPRTSAATHVAVPRRQPDRVRLWPGPRLDWFEPGAWRQLLDSSFAVASTNRVGCRLNGPPLHRTVGAELPSEGLIEGALQVPPDGHPIVMLADHPTTGGYPVIAVVEPDDLWVIAQAAPGDVLLFADASPRRTTG